MGWQRCRGVEHGGGAAALISLAGLGRGYVRWRRGRGVGDLAMYETGGGAGVAGEGGNTLLVWGTGRVVWAERLAAGSRFWIRSR